MESFHIGRDEEAKLRALKRIFHNKDRNELLEVLRSHDGSVEHAVDELLTKNYLEEDGGRASPTGPSSSSSSANPNIPSSSAAEDREQERQLARERKRLLEEQRQVESERERLAAERQRMEDDLSRVRQEQQRAQSQLEMERRRLEQQQREADQRQRIIEQDRRLADAELRAQQLDLERIEQERKECSLRDRLHEAAAAAASINHDSAAEPAHGLPADTNVIAPRAVPTVVLYRSSAQTTKKSIDELKACRALLVVAGVPESEIVEADIANDYEMVSFLKSHISGDITFPIVMIKSHVIGQHNALAELCRDKERLAAMLSEDGEGAPSEPLTYGIMDHAVDAAEFLLKLPIMIPVGVGKTLASLFWWGSSKNEDEDPYQDFNVIQSNWYWRHQRRRLRCTKDYLMRLHPTDDKDVRAAHAYDSIESVTFLDDINITIAYRDGSPDYYRATKPDITRLVAIILARAGNTPPTLLDKRRRMSKP